MTTRAGDEVVGFLVEPYSSKVRIQRHVAIAAPLVNSSGTTFKMRGRDTGAGFVWWIASDPLASYPGTLVGSLVDKQIVCVIRTLFGG